MENKLYEYIKGTRGVGHTTLLMDGAKNAKTPFFIVGADLRHAKELIKTTGNNKLAIPATIYDNKLIGNIHPVLIDNHTFMVTCEDYEREIQKSKYMVDKLINSLTEKEEELKQSKETLKKIKKLPFFIRVFKPLYRSIITRYENE